MYFPYLRGKQYELIALRELSQLLGQQGRTVPIIEPVRTIPTSGLEKCLDALVNSALTPIVIMNPSVGDLKNRQPPPSVVKLIAENSRSQGWILGIHIRSGVDPYTILRQLSGSLGPRRYAFIVTDRSSASDDLKKLSDSVDCNYAIIHDSIKPRYLGNLLASVPGVTLSDGFPVKARNIEYVDCDESDFSDEYLYYEGEGWQGFSDFLTIGEPYSDGGFAPRAVVIHWTYIPEANAPVMIRHFTSVSNDDTSNVGGKFLEAARQLVEFLDERKIRTRASEVIREHVDRSTYPGLGILKKLSIQNHLELVSETLWRR